MSVWVTSTPSPDKDGPLNISQEILRSVLYGKWCNVFGGQKELTFKSGLLEKVDYNSDEGNVHHKYGLSESCFPVNFFLQNPYDGRGAN